MKLLNLLTILFFAVIGMSAQTVDLTELEKTIEAELENAKTPGAAFAVISGDKVIFAKGFGFTSSEDAQPVTAETLFRLGSTTKMFTAAAVVNLANSGKLKIDAPVGNYIKGLKPKIASLNSHQLLSQSSGLRDIPTTIFSNDDKGLKLNILDWNDDIFFTEPNKIYSYSSANYWLAGLLAEEVYGKSYSDVVAETILRPLGMKSSTLRPFEAMTYRLALGHDIKNGSATVIRPIDNNTAKFPGGSLYSNINELSRFAIAMLNDGKIDGKQVIASTVVNEIVKAQFFLPGDDGTFYGYGVMGYDDSGVRTISHGGVSRGYGSTIFFAPDQKIAIIVLANSNAQTLPRSRRKAMELLLPLKNEPSTNSANDAPSGVDLSKYVGRYSHAPQTWEFAIKDSKLFLTIDEKEFELRQIDKDTFAYSQGRFLFVKNTKGDYEHIFTGLYAAKKLPKN